MKRTKFFTLIFVLIIIVGCAGCGTNHSGKISDKTTPKYIFLFIGDGMSYPQFQLASDYLGAMEDKDHLQALPSLEKEDRKGVLDGPAELNFMKFDTVGTAVTFDSCSFIPDSAAAGTAISTGQKTYSNTISMDETGTVAYESIAEKLHKQLGWKIGIISSANLNHATPAVFYAHQPKRTNYYDIGIDLVNSGFEYFAGGGFRNVYGDAGDKQNIYEVAANVGYQVVMTEQEAKTVTADTGKVIMVGEHLADSDSLEYSIDRTENSWTLADYVEKGIEVLDNETGFFMMCEGGKIDWACHANDAGTVLTEVLDFAEAIEPAIEFAKKHPKETLILVTGDHETGGLSIGYAATEYDTYLTNLSLQKISFQKFTDDYISRYKENQLSFREAMKDVEVLFGLTMDDENAKGLQLTEAELKDLEYAYELTLADYPRNKMNDEHMVLYNTYDPFTVAVCRILNHRSGLDFTSFTHTGLPVAVFASGAGADYFDGYYDNTEIFHRLVTLTGVK